MKKETNEAMTKDEIEDFKKKLYKGEVKFKYKKVDGSERTATGTTCPDLLPPPPEKKEYDKDILQGKKVPKKRPEGIVCYYDLDSKGWRSFKAENFIEVVS